MLKPSAPRNFGLPFLMLLFTSVLRSQPIAVTDVFSVNKQGSITATVQSFPPIKGFFNRQIQCFSQEERGFIWIGTPYGVFRFDGNDFLQITKEKQASQIHGLRSMAEDADGKVWVFQAPSSYSGLKK